MASDGCMTNKNSMPSSAWDTMQIDLVSIGCPHCVATTVYPFAACLSWSCVDVSARFNNCDMWLSQYCLSIRLVIRFIFQIIYSDSQYSISGIKHDFNLQQKKRQHCLLFCDDIFWNVCVFFFFAFLNTLWKYRNKSWKITKFILLYGMLVRWCQPNIHHQFVY